MPKPPNRKAEVEATRMMHSNVRQFLTNLDDCQDDFSCLFDFIRGDKAVNRSFHIWLIDWLQLKKSTEKLYEDLNSLKNRIDTITKKGQE